MITARFAFFKQERDIARRSWKRIAYFGATKK